MKEVTINKHDLRTRVQKNLLQHRETYETAFIGYARAAVRFFEQQLASARDGKQFIAYFNEPMPEDHTVDYEAVLDMIDMEVSQTITLTASEFRQYVRDDWGWKKEFLATTSNYLFQD